MQPTYSLVEVLANQWRVGIVSLLASLATVPLCRWLAYRTGIVDKPDDLLKPQPRKWTSNTSSGLGGGPETLRPLRS